MSLLASRRPPITLYADPTMHIPFTPGSEDAAPYEARFAECTTRYRYLTTTNNTYAGFVAQYAALSAEDKAGAIMADPELPWLVILSRPLSQGVNTTWKTNAAVMNEFTRKATALGHPTTLVAPSGASTLATYTLGDFKWLAYNQRIDIRAAATLCPAGKFVYYGASGLPFSDYTGTPVGWSRGINPATLIDYAQYVLGRSYSQADPTFVRTMRKYFDDTIADEVQWALIKAAGDAHAIPVYCFVPNSDLALEMMPYWGSADTTRKLAGVTQSPDYIAADIRYGVRDHARRLIAEFGRSMAAAYDAGDVSAADVGKPIDAIIFSLGNHAVRNSFLDWNHWHGLGMKDPIRTAEDELAPLFARGDANAPFVRPVRSVWMWTWYGYFVNEPMAVTNVSTADPVADAYTNGNRRRARATIEKLLCGRAAVGVGEPFATAVLATQDTWFNSNTNGCMPDSIWSTPSAVLRTSGGTDNIAQYGCSVAAIVESLGDYGFPSSGEALTSDLTDGLNHYVADAACTQAEAYRAVLDEVVR